VCTHAQRTSAKHTRSRQVSAARTAGATAKAEQSWIQGRRRINTTTSARRDFFAPSEGSRKPRRTACKLPLPSECTAPEHLYSGVCGRHRRPERRRASIACRQTKPPGSADSMRPMRATRLPGPGLAIALRAQLLRLLLAVAARLSGAQPRSCCSQQGRLLVVMQRTQQQQSLLRYPLGYHHRSAAAHKWGVQGRTAEASPVPANAGCTYVDSVETRGVSGCTTAVANLGAQGGQLVLSG
jgi:hypothetical protein